METNWMTQEIEARRVAMDRSRAESRAKVEENKRKTGASIRAVVDRIGWDRASTSVLAKALESEVWPCHEWMYDHQMWCTHVAVEWDDSVSGSRKIRWSGEHEFRTGGTTMTVTLGG